LRHPLAVSRGPTETEAPTEARSTATRSRTPTPSPVSVSETGHNNIPLQDGDELVMTISMHPMFVILPALSSLMATVYDSTGDETATFSSPTNVFAVYFSESNGSIVFSATAQTILKYFAVKLSFGCPVYFLSSSPNEMWSASRTKGKFTLDNLQDVCLIHVSDNITSAAGAYDIEMNFDFLYYQYSGSTSTNQFYTGMGSFDERSDGFTVFR
jgi:hypothetical protein